MSELGPQGAGYAARRSPEGVLSLTIAAIEQVGDLYRQGEFVVVHHEVVPGNPAEYREARPPGDDRCSVVGVLVVFNEGAGAAAHAAADIPSAGLVVIPRPERCLVPGNAAERSAQPRRIGRGRGALVVDVVGLGYLQAPALNDDKVQVRLDALGNILNSVKIPRVLSRGLLLYRVLVGDILAGRDVIVDAAIEAAVEELALDSKGLPDVILVLSRRPVGGDREVGLRRDRVRHIRREFLGDLVHGADFRRHLCAEARLLGGGQPPIDTRGPVLGRCCPRVAAVVVEHVYAALGRIAKVPFLLADDIVAGAPKQRDAVVEHALLVLKVVSAIVAENAPLLIKGGRLRIDQRLRAAAQDGLRRLLVVVHRIPAVVEAARGGDQARGDLHERQIVLAEGERVLDSKEVLLVDKLVVEIEGEPGVSVIAEPVGRGAVGERELVIVDCAQFEEVVARVIPLGVVHQGREDPVMVRQVQGLGFLAGPGVRAVEEEDALSVELGGDHLIEDRRSRRKVLRHPIVDIQAARDGGGISDVGLVRKLKVRAAQIRELPSDALKVDVEVLAVGRLPCHRKPLIVLAIERIRLVRSAVLRAYAHAYGERRAHHPVNKYAAPLEVIAAERRLKLRGVSGKPGLVGVVIDHASRPEQAVENGGRPLQHLDVVDVPRSIGLPAVKAVAEQLQSAETLYVDHRFVARVLDAGHEHQGVGEPCGAEVLDEVPRFDVDGDGRIEQRQGQARGGDGTRGPVALDLASRYLEFLEFDHFVALDLARFIRGSGGLGLQPGNRRHEEARQLQ